MSRGGQWYTTLPRHQRRVVDAVAKWLRPVQWQWFVTITFPWNVRSETADKKLKALIDGLERHHRAIVGFVAGKESRSRHDGSRVPWHFHLLITSQVPISREAVECLWLGLIRRGLQSDADFQNRREHAKVEAYQAHERGPEYCLKTMSDETGDWYIHRLEHFLPGIPGAARPNHRTVRHQRRNAPQHDVTSPCQLQRNPLLPIPLRE
jgi:hypothetical protein